MNQICTRCPRPANGTAICPGCVDTFREDLSRLPALLEDLAVSVSRQSKVTRGNRHRPQPIEDVVAVAVEKTIPARLRSRQGRITLAPHALPVNLGAADLADHVTALLSGWVRALADGVTDPRLYGWHLHGPICVDLCWHPSCAQLRGLPARPIDQIAFIRRGIPRIQQRKDSPLWVDDLQRAVRDIEYAIDSSEPEVFAGPCDAADITHFDDTGTGWTDEDGVTHLDDSGTIRIDLRSDRICGALLFAVVGSDTVTCKACGQQYDIAERRDYMLKTLRTYWWTPAAIASSLTSLHMPLPAKMLHNWIDRDRNCHASGRAIQDTEGVWRNPRTGYRLILCVGTDYTDENGVDILDAAGEPLGRALYCIGDVIDVLEARALAETARKVASA